MTDSSSLTVFPREADVGRECVLAHTQTHTHIESLHTPGSELIHDAVRSHSAAGTSGLCRLR